MEDKNTNSHMELSGQPEDNQELTNTPQKDPQRVGKRADKDDTTQTGSSGASPLWKLQWRGFPVTTDEFKKLNSGNNDHHGMDMVVKSTGHLEPKPPHGDRKEEPMVDQPRAPR